MSATAADAANDVPVAVFNLPLCADDAPAAEIHRTYEAQRDRALLQQNAVWFCRLRWGVVCVLTAAHLRLSTSLMESGHQRGSRYHRLRYQTRSNLPHAGLEGPTAQGIKTIL